ncbi:MAG TPA: tetratricopeptide repeat protein [Candidatus Binatia bacterium]
MKSTATQRTISKRALLLLVVLAMFPYANALNAGFTFDDEADIQKNPAITGGLDLARIVAAPFPPGTIYRPFAVLTFALNERLAPGNTVAYHGVNVLLHAGVAVLVFVLARRLFGSVRTAQIAAVLFALHPVHTEAVTSLVGRTELLAALFGLAAILSMDRADTAAHWPARVSLYLLSLTSFSLALFSKESALVVVPLILLFRIARRREPLVTGLVTQLGSLDWVPYALCAGVFLFFRYLVVGGLMVNTPTPLDNALAFVPWSIRVRSALGILWDYFGLLNFPLVLAADYSYAQVHIIDTWTTPRFVAGLALGVAAGCVIVRDRRPAITFAVAFPFVALSLTSNLLFPVGTIKAERLLYFPSVGWALLVAFGFDHLTRVQRYRPIIIGLLAILVGAFALRTWTRNSDWLDDATLYRSMVRSAPNSAKAHYNMGVAFQKEGADAAAIAEFRRALEIYPYDAGAGAPLGIGISYEKQGRMDQAIEWYKKALDLEPELGGAHTNLCRALLRERRFDEAATACRRGLRYSPSDANLLKWLGASLVGAGEMGKGVAVWRRSLALNEQDEELRDRLAQLESASAGSDQRVVAPR